MIRMEMTSAKRLEQALQHKEPDRVPFDLGSTAVTGITIKAYQNLLSYLGIERKEISVFDIVEQLAVMDEELLQRFKVDTRGVVPNPPSNWRLEIEEDKKYTYFTDEWQIKWRMLKEKGYYYDMIDNPLKGKMTKEKIDRWSWPDPCDSCRFKGLEKKAKHLTEKTQSALIMEPMTAGYLEICFWVRGMEEFYMDLASNPSLACYLMDKLVELKIRYWKCVLEKLGEHILIIRESDDLGGQNGLLISPQMYRKYIKPRHKKIFSFIKKTAPKKIYIFLHTCGSVYDIIPDFIEIGVDILNPVQVSAAKMDTKKLKRQFGDAITFWGGGVDTQKVLPYGTPEEVRDEVRRRLDDLTPGGGFVFTPVHNIQPDVPPENVIAMWEAFRKFGKY